MGYRYIVVEGRGGYDPQEPIESWELKGTKSNGVDESLVMSDDKMHKFNKPYPIVNTTKDIAGSEVKFWRNLVDTLLNKGVLLSESGDNKLYFVVPAHGFGNIGRILYHLCNRQDTESITVCYDYYTVRETSGYLDEVLAYFTEVYRQSDIQLHIIEGYTFERALISCGVHLRFNRADEYYKTGTGADLWELHMQALLLQPKVLNYSERITDFVPPTLMALAPNADSFEQLYAGILKHLLPEGSCFSVSTTQQSIQQSDRWEGTGDIWRVRNANGNGYLTNSWFQDLDGSWYMLGADGIMYSGLVTDQSTGKSYLLNTQHDGTFGRMLTTDGVYNVNGVNVYLTFNQQHDGTFGAITSGLNEVRSSGVRETSLAAIPTDSATGNTSQGASATSQNQTSNSNSSYEDYINSLKAKPIDQLTSDELDALIEWQSGGKGTAVRPGELDMDAAASIQLNGQ